MTDAPFGPGRRDALLIATGQYDDSTLSSLRSPRQDSAGLAGVLAEPGIGGFRTEQLTDARAHEVTRALERFFRDRSRDDLLLLHISCHGIKDDDGHLYFAARDTDRDLPASTAVPAAFLRGRMELCRARTIVVLLDCCYSGAFIPGSKGDDRIHVRDELGGHGRAVLTATSRTEYAWEGSRVESAVPEPSRFTGALIKGLATGAADLNGDGRITVTELYDYVYESLHRAGVRQRPRIWVDLEYQVTIARAVRAPAGGQDADPREAAGPREAFVPPRPEEPPAAGAGGPGAGAAVSEVAPPGPESSLLHRMRDAFRGEAGAGATGRTQFVAEPAAGAPAEADESYPRPRTRRGQDALIRLEVDLAEVVFGCTKEIAVRTAVVCAACSGTGGENGARPRECSDCGGRGLRLETPRRSTGAVLIGRPCPKCESHGTVLRRPCPVCRGEGRVPADRTLTLKVPGGIDEGTRIQLAGEGEAGPGGGPAGDLYVEIVVRPHSVFGREGDDLVCTMRIPRAVATAGGTLPLRTLDGSKTVRVPRGIRDGQSLRLPELGVTRLHAGGRGDLLVRVEVRD
ncbi:caspase, EACC1-associated type [Streptomyces sp. IBSBF 2435]|uniref:caspase, EACC1-associated type n=1 Tax=Streptomyces sp. IBSBF 2435 TaxID=2903531 RepID=UPI002FDC4D13